MKGIRVTRSLVIPDDEIKFTFSPSGGPGGQHANRSSTRAELVWNVEDSRAVGPRQRDRIKAGLKRRIDANGNIRVASDRHRSQLRNREEAASRLAGLLAAALKPPKARVGTAPTKAAKERRLKAKRKRSDLKKNRRSVRDLEGNG
ncbi:MAG TPA: alternative ribosome rescue aminoacyl-tRNA hydrolase ArfB [Actinomycetota bacterium]|nr:alternative ribosome rescue aminoacyl-tRNA hydrolase ArfB [Actinomycetota bacterium]